MYRIVDGGIVRMDKRHVVDRAEDGLCVRDDRKRCIGTLKLKEDVSMHGMRYLGKLSTQNAAEGSAYGRMSVSLCGTCAVRGSKQNAYAGSSG